MYIGGRELVGVTGVWGSDTWLGLMGVEWALRIDGEGRLCISSSTSPIDMGTGFRLIELLDFPLTSSCVRPGYEVGGVVGDIVDVGDEEALLLEEVGSGGGEEKSGDGNDRSEMVD